MTIYSEEMAKKVCKRISEGDSLIQMCKEEGMPSERAIYSWLIDRSEFLAMYDIAKEKQMEVYANQIIDLADKCTLDKGAAEKAKLQIFARQWVMGRLKPKKYGDRTVISGDKDNPIALSLATTLDQRIAERESRRTIEHKQSESLPVIDIDCQSSGDS